MKQVDLQTWEEFDAHILQLSNEHAAHLSATKCYVSEYLFRGQSDSSWHLITTLERHTKRLLTLSEYYKIICAAKPQIETFTGAAWEKIPTLAEYEGEMALARPWLHGKFPAYEYFAYLRHHGFPSPLLDWTRSPYIAAYFAFLDVCSTATTVSIYAYREFIEGYKWDSSHEPRIIGLGPYVRSHRRHFQQQSQYTICTIPRNGEHAYACHEDAFTNQVEGQDELWKFNIPASEREKVLKKLEQYNITAFSLFGSEESLMETLSFRELLFRTHR